MVLIPFTQSFIHYLTASVNGSNVILNWNAYGSGASGLLVYRDNQQIASLPTGQTNYTDINALSTTPKTYRVYAYNLYGSTPSVSINVCQSPSIINTYTLWTGVVYINSNVTVSSGTTLNIGSGTKVIFNSGYNYNITLNGQMNVDGLQNGHVVFISNAANPGISNYGTITLSGSGAANSTISYADISYGTRLEAINTTNIKISNCNINNTYDGIRFSGATGNVLNNIISTNSVGHGIIVENGSTVSCYQNKITKTNTVKTGVGILFRASSGGIIWQNDISGWDWGVGAIYSSSPTVYNNPIGPPYRNNRIRNCNYGMQIYNNSFPTIGGPAQGSGFNDIYNNSIKNILFTSGGQLYAYSTFWGGSAPESSMFTLGTGCSIQTNTWLSNDPWQGLLKTTSSAKEIYLAGNKTSNINAGSIFEGIELRIQNKLKEAKDFFINYLLNHPEDQSAYVELYNCYNDENANDILKYFSALPYKAAKEQKLLLSFLYLKQGNVEMAKRTNTNIILENTNSKLQTDAKLNNMYISLYYDDNLASAIDIFKDILKKPKLSGVLDLALARQAIESYANAKNVTKFELPEIPKITNDSDYDMSYLATGLPENFDLVGNYPNPFNPITTIKYALPQNSNVILEVYNILGEKVAGLVNEVKSAGYHEAQFNAGSNLSSGIYIYRMTTNSLETGERFVKSAKMLLLK